MISNRIIKIKKNPKEITQDYLAFDPVDQIKGFLVDGIRKKKDKK